MHEKEKTERIAGLKTEELDDLADKLVAEHHGHGNRLLGPGGPVVDVEGGAADAGAVDSDQDIVDADFWDRHIL